MAKPASTIAGKESTAANTNNSGPTYINDGKKICDINGCTYTLMAPIGSLLGDSKGQYIINKNDQRGLCSLLNSWFRIGIALAGMLAVVMIVLGGFQYATTDSLFDKEEGKGKIQNALWGLLLALTTWLIVSTINPALANCTINAKEVELKALPTVTQNVVDGAVAGGLAGMMVSRDGTLGVSTSGSGASGDYSYLNNLNTGTDTTFTTYGYPGDTTSNKNDRERRGNNENLLTEGSVALSPDVISRLKPEHGAAVYVGGNLVGYYDDSSASQYNGRAITNTVDIFDPSGSLGGNSFSKNVTGAITIDNNKIRTQKSNPSK